MRVRLMHRDRDFDLHRGLPDNADALAQDLELATLVNAMAGGDDQLAEVARAALFSGRDNGLQTILYRQAIGKDCRNNSAVVRRLHDLAVSAIAQRKKLYFSVFMHYPSAILQDSIKIMRMFMGALRDLREIADTQGRRFESEGFVTLFAMLQREFDDAYFARVETHLAQLNFDGGVVVSADLGAGNRPHNFVLRRDAPDQPTWFDRLLHRGAASHTFYLADRDEAGAKILSELRDRALNSVANALAQSTEHILGFFQMLRTELAFYVGCLNLEEKLAAMLAPFSFPHPGKRGCGLMQFARLYDVCLALGMGKSVVGNTVDANAKRVVIVTGANQGGKSSFLRAVGLAQLMMQAGMPVAADAFSAELCSGVFTHYKREEDATMQGGKLDEELRRMSEIAEAIVPESLMLFNESFASTNEREGSEIARQVVRALLDSGIRVFFVTHLYEFAHGIFERNRADTVFLHAERRPDGSRSFKLVQAEPQQTSYGKDLYREIFESETASSGTTSSGQRSDFS